MSLRVAAALALLVAICDGLPIVDPGLFVIMGVRTCGDGDGYCLLGTDCTLDDDFVPDVKGGHCDGLRNAFTPSAPFVCCRYNAKPGNATTITSKTTDAAKVTTTITSLTSESTVIDKSKTEATTTTTTLSSDAEQDWSPIAGPFPVFGQDGKEVELDVSIPVGHRPASSSTTSGFVEDESGPGLSDSFAPEDISITEGTSGSEASSGVVVSSISTTSSDPEAILGLGDDSPVDPASRERWLLGRLRKRQETSRSVIAH